MSRTFALVNTTNPSQPPPINEAVGLAFSLVNPLNPSQDSDNDGFRVFEVSVGTNPLDPTSVPNAPLPTREVTGRTFALVNTTDPSQPLPVSEAVGAVSSVENLP